MDDVPSHNCQRVTDVLLIDKGHLNFWICQETRDDVSVDTMSLTCREGAPKRLQEATGRFVWSKSLVNLEVNEVK